MDFTTTHSKFAHSMVKEATKQLATFTSPESDPNTHALD